MATEGNHVESGYFLDSLDKDLQCSVCGEVKQLRLLPCQDMCCLQCLEKIYLKAETTSHHQTDSTPRPLRVSTPQPLTDHINEYVPACPTCNLPLTDKPTVYPICTLAEHFREMKEKLEKACYITDQCQSNGCKRGVEKQCIQCGRFICYRCREDPCEGTDDEHVTKDITELVSDSKEAYTTWQQGTNLKLTVMKNEMEKATAETKRLAGELADSENLEVYERTIIIVPLLEKCTDTMVRLQPRIAKLESELALMSSVMEKTTSEIETIKVIQGLQEHGRIYMRALDEMTSIITDKHCDDAQVGPSGDIVACFRNSVQVVDSSTGELVKKINYEGYQVYAVQHYKNRVVLIMQEAVDSSTFDANQLLKHYVVQLDQSYQEILRWEARWRASHATDMAVIEGKVHLSDFQTGDIEVYDLNTGEKLAPVIIRNGESRALAQFQPSSIVVLDNKYNTVQKYNINKRKFTPIWTQEVIKPWAAGVDEHGLIWIRSNTFDCITIITRSGKKIQELVDDRITKLGTVHGIGVFNEYLWICTSDGLFRFKIKAAECFLNWD